MLTEGQNDRTLVIHGSKTDIAQSIINTLEGAMLIARPYGDLDRFNTAARLLLAGLTH